MLQMPPGLVKAGAKRHVTMPPRKNVPQGREQAESKAPSMVAGRHVALS